MTLQIRVVRFYIFRRRVGGGCIFAAEQCQLECCSNSLGDFGLNCEDVLKFTIENSRPQLRSIRGVNQFGNNSHLVPLLSHSAFQKRAYTQLFADRFGFLISVFETKGRAATDDLEVSDSP